MLEEGKEHQYFSVSFYDGVGVNHFKNPFLCHPRYPLFVYTMPIGDFHVFGLEQEAQHDTR